MDISEILRILGYTEQEGFDWLMDEFEADEEAEDDAGGVMRVSRAKAKLFALGYLEELKALAGILDDDNFDIVFSPDRQTAYVSNARLDSITVIDMGARKVTKVFRTGIRPTKLAISSDGLYLFVYNSLDGTISKIDAETGEEKALMPVGESLIISLALSEDGESLLVSDLLKGSLHSFDTLTGAKQL